MADSTLNRFVSRGTAAQRALFTPSPPTPSSGPSQGYFWYETDTGNTYTWDGAAWDQVNTAGAVPDPIVPADGTQNITGALVVSGAVSGSNLSGTNTGDQTSIVGITGTIAQFNTACSDADFATGGGTATGTNTGDQTITLTGNVTGSGTGSFAATIANDAVTFAKMQNAIASSKLIGSGDAGIGADYVEITLGTNLSMSGTTLNATGGGSTPTGTGFVHITAGAQDAAAKLVDTADINANQVTFDKVVAAASAGVIWASGAGNYAHNASGGGTANFLRADGTWAAPGGSGTVTTTGTPASGNLTAFSGASSITNSNLSGDVTTSNTLATTIAANAVSNAKFRQSAGLSVVGRSANTTGDVADITGAANGVLRVSGTTLAFGAVDLATAMVTGDLPFSNIAQIATDRLLGRDTAATGDIEALTVGGGIEFTGTGGIQTSAFTGDVTKSAGGTATTIANDAVTLAKLQNAVASSKLLGSGATGAGADYAEITLGTNLSMSGTTLNASGSGSTPTGTGFRHVTGGVEDAAAVAVNLATSDVTGDLPYANLTPSGNASRILGRTSVSAGDWQECTPGMGLFFSQANVHASGDSLNKIYTFSTTTTNADPGPNTFRFNNATLASVTAIYIDDIDLQGITNDTFFGYLSTGYRIYVTQQGSGTQSAIFQISGAVTDNTGYWTIPVTVVSSGTLPSNSTNCNICFVPIAGGGSVPTGTGFTHITAGAQDAAAKLVDTADINDAQVTYAKIQNATAGLSVVGRATNTAGVNADIAAALDGQVLRRSGTSIGFGALDLGHSNATTSTLALDKLVTISAASVLGRSAATTGVVAAIASSADGEVMRRSGTTIGWGTIATAGIADGAVTGAKLSANGQVRCITFIIDGGGSTITTGVKGDLEIPFACTITGWTMLLDQSGSIVVDIWKDTYANYPPTVADTITASDKPTISATTKGQDLAPTGWTTSVAAGDTLRFNVDSITTATRAVLSIRVNVT